MFRLFLEAHADVAATGAGAASLQRVGAGPRVTAPRLLRYQRIPHALSDKSPHPWLPILKRPWPQPAVATGGSLKVIHIVAAGCVSALPLAGFAQGEDSGSVLQEV